jgi:RNA polymerase sigma-70 factor (ECF subfamily)
MSSPVTQPVLGNAHWFATTHWSVVMAARQSDSAEAEIALEQLCRAYWRPLYAYIRRDGSNATDAQDLTQDFFARLLSRDYLQRIHHREGKFRSFFEGAPEKFFIRAAAESEGSEAGWGLCFHLDRRAGRRAWVSH